MKYLLIVMLWAFSCSGALAADESIVFLHHSTGGIIYDSGQVENWFADYNGAHNASYTVVERAYPTDPYRWANYPYDYWYLWVKGECSADNPNIHCLDQLAADYDVVIFKNCYPVSGVVEDTGSPDISSDRKSLENYQLQYAAVRDKLQQYPNTLFIFWTGAPLRDVNTNLVAAARARQFANWVKGDMLAGGNYPNIRVFDYFDLTTGSNNMLRPEYERTSSLTDNHPNTQAAEDVAPVFSQFIIDSAQAFFDSVTVGECGNAILEKGEECDDGAGNGNPCSPLPGETCTYCTSMCTLKVVDGKIPNDFVLMQYLLPILTSRNKR